MRASRTSSWCSAHAWSRMAGQLGPVQPHRHAVEVWKAGQAPHMICTGGFKNERLSAAAVCRRVAIQLGVPAERIVLADGTSNTAEDAHAAAQVMAERGWRTAILVSHPLHLFRARWLFEREGVTGCHQPDVHTRGPDRPAVAAVVHGARSRRRRRNAPGRLGLAAGGLEDAVAGVESRIIVEGNLETGRLGLDRVRRFTSLSTNQSNDLPIHDYLETNRRRETVLGRETGTIHKDHGGRLTVALAYPNRYYVGMSSLALQILYRRFNAEPDVVCERVFWDEGRLADRRRWCRWNPDARGRVRRLGVHHLVRDGLLQRGGDAAQAGVPPLARRPRRGRSPLLIAGGPGITHEPRADGALLRRHRDRRGRGGAAAADRHPATMASRRPGGAAGRAGSPARRLRAAAGRSLPASTAAADRAALGARPGARPTGVVRSTRPTPSSADCT